MPEEIDGVEVIAFASAAEFETWLESNHGRAAGVWLKVAKKGTGLSTLSTDEQVDAGLCWGWISGQRRALDSTHYLQKYVPRRPRSLWSQVNVEKVEQLLAAGRMREPGLAEMRAAQADGRWEAAYQSQRNLTVPPDLAAELDRDPRAKAAFEALDRTGRYLVILPLLQARTEAARTARLKKALARLTADDG